jgi:hypothetical protein
MKTRCLALFGLVSATCFGQLSTDQRLADFRNLGDLYARRYAGIEWKKAAVNFNLLDLTPWYARVSTVKSDLDFYDLMVEYVSDLSDAHDQYYLPSDFEAYLGFSVDVFDGKTLIDTIDRTQLPAAKFPFETGDQLVSVDGQTTADLVKQFSKYVSGGNPRTVQRLAAELVTDRYQGYYPYAHQIGDTAAVVIMRQSGAVENYTIAWSKSGTPLTTLGASQSPSSIPSLAEPRATARRTPFYQQLLQKFHNYTLPGRVNIVGWDESQPVWTLPEGFVPHSRSFDAIFAGTYKAADGTRIGYIRIPDFMNPTTSSMDREVRYMQANTDVLVVDVMRNPGGDVCLAEDLISRLTPNSFQGTSAEFRVEWTDIVSVNQGLADATSNGADQDTIDQYQIYQNEFQSAFLKNQGRTNRIPVCAATATRSPAASAYTKPVLVMADELSASSADIFAAMIQDNHIAPLFGYRTMGAGGSPEDNYVGVYSEGSTSVTRSMIVRLQPVTISGYPTTSYIENVGVHPDILVDYMTTDNLLNKGAPFVKAFTDAAVALIKK